MGSVNITPKDWSKVLSGEWVLSRKSVLGNSKAIKLLEVVKRKLM